MSAHVFTNLWIIELGMIAAWTSATWVWRRQGPKRALSTFALLVVLGELVEVVVQGHPTELGQFLAFTAISLFAARVFIDREARAALVPGRAYRRLTRR